MGGQVSESIVDLHKINQEIGGYYDTIKEIEGLEFDDIAFFNADGGSDDATKAADLAAAALKALHEELAKIEKIKLDNLKKSQEAINDLIDMTVDLIEKENELYKDQLSDRKEALKLAEDEADLQKELAGLNKDRAKLESELMKLKLDKSQNNNAKILELEEELSKQKLTITEKLEDDAYNEKVKVLDEEIDAVDSYLDKEGVVRQDAMDRINEDFKNGTNELFNDLINYNDVYGTSIESDISGAWDSATAAMTKYSEGLSTISTSGVLGAINTKKLESQMALNSANWYLTDSQGEKDDLHSANKILASQLSGGTSSFNSGTGEWDIPKHGKGGYFDKEHLAIVGDTAESIIPDTKMGGFISEAVERMQLNQNAKMVSSIGSGDNSSTTIQSLITIHGNVDEKIMPKLQNAANDIADAFKNTGNLKGFKTIDIM